MAESGVLHAIDPLASATSNCPLEPTDDGIALIVAGFDDSFDHGTDSPPFSTQLVVPSPFVARTRPETSPDDGFSTFFEIDSTSGVKTAFTTSPPSMDDEKDMPDPLRIETMSDAMAEPSLTADIPVM